MMWLVCCLLILVTSSAASEGKNQGQFITGGVPYLKIFFRLLDQADGSQEVGDMQTQRTVPTPDDNCNNTDQHRQPDLATLDKVMEACGRILQFFTDHVSQMYMDVVIGSRIAEGKFSLQVTETACYLLTGKTVSCK